MLLDQQAKAVEGIIDSLDPEADDPVRLWMQAYETQLRDHLDDLILTAPWLKVPLWAMMHSPKEEGLTRGSAEHVVRLSELQAELLKLDSIPSLKEVPEMAMKLMPMIDQILGSLQGEDRRDERDMVPPARADDH